MKSEALTPLPRFLVAGFGYVGEPLCRLLAGWGFAVTAVSRSGGESGIPGVPLEACDISEKAAVEALAERVGEIGGVVHCASSSGNAGREEAYRAVYFHGCRNLLAAFSPKRFVFTGSTSVYAQTDGSVITEESPAEPGGATGKLLREAENVVLGAGQIVARLAGIYGPGRSFLLKRYLEGEAAIDGDSDADAGRWINQIHRDDAAAALALLATSGVTGIFNVCDDTSFLQRSFYERLAASLRRPMPPTRPPDTGRKRGWTHKQVSNARLRALGWEPRYASYFKALEKDAELLSSIRAQVSSESGAAR